MQMKQLKNWDRHKVSGQKAKKYQTEITFLDETAQKSGQTLTFHMKWYKNPDGHELSGWNDTKIQTYKVSG